MEFSFSLSTFLADHSDQPFFMLLVLMVVIWTTGRIFARLDLPMILGEIFAGIALGPSVFGILQETETIKVLAELGIFFMMFHAGLDTNLKDMIRSCKNAITTSLAGIIAIVGLTVLLWKIFPGIFFGTSFLGILFGGLVFAAVSFPVITPMLRHFRIKNTKIGRLVISSAIFTEIFVFIGVSILLSLHSSGNFEIQYVLDVIGRAIAFFLGTIFLGKCILPLFRIFLNRTGSKAFTFSLIIALVFAIFAELIGLHFILGAYLGGMFVREEIENEKLFEKIEDRYFGFSYSFLGPIFFATVGMNISLDVFEAFWKPMLLVVAVIAVAQMITGGICTKWLEKVSSRHAFVAASALLGRGALDVVLTKIGYEAGVFGEEMFSFIITVTLILIFLSSFLIEIGVHFLRKNS